MIDSQVTTDTFGLEPTPLDDTLRAALEHYREPPSLAPHDLNTVPC